VFSCHDRQQHARDLHSRRDLRCHWSDGTCVFALAASNDVYLCLCSVTPCRSHLQFDIIFTGSGGRVSDELEVPIGMAVEKLGL